MSHPQSILPLPASLTVAASCVVAIVVGLSLPTNHDEYQYVAAAYLFRTVRIYADFFYSQTPYFPAVLSAWLWLTEGAVASPYVAARLFNVGWSLVFIVALFRMLFRLSPSRFFAAAIGVALICMEITGLPLRVARNDMMPLALTTVALSLLVDACLAEGSRRRTARYLAAGVLIAAAVGTKQSYAFVALSVALHAAVASPIKERWTTQVLPLALGGALGTLPMLVMVSASPANFLYGVSEFHRTHHLWWGATTPEAEAAMTSLPVRGYVLVRTLANAPLVVLAISSAAFIACTRGAGGRRLWSVLLLSAGTVIAGLPFFLLAVPLHPQYVAPILPFIGAAAAASAALMAASRMRLLDGRRSLHATAALLLAATLAHGLWPPGRGALAQLRAVTWGMSAQMEGVWIWHHANRVGARLTEVLGSPDPALHIATIMSIYPLEAGFGIYPDLASAPFFYQTNDRMPPAQVAGLVGTSPALAHAWLTRRNVRAVLVGYRHDLDAPFRAHAEGNGFLCFRVDLRGGQADNAEPKPGELWISPELARTSPDC